MSLLIESTVDIAMYCLSLIDVLNEVKCIALTCPLYYFSTICTIIGLAERIQHIYGCVFHMTMSTTLVYAQMMLWQLSICVYALVVS